jgi:hypothetical protein
MQRAPVMAFHQRGSAWECLDESSALQRIHRPGRLQIGDIE